MKKLISVILCLALLFSCAAITAAAAETELKITVANDLHLDLTSVTAEKVSKKNNLSEEYAHVASGGQLHYESLAIINAFLAEAAKNESEFILLPGDITNKGTAEEHEALASILKEFEETSGKQVFVINGNHDLLKTEASAFKEYYADFGYNEALAVDSSSASYTAELSNGYRLLAIDSCAPRLSTHTMDEERISWIEEQCKKASEDGKKLIAIMHHNLLEHYILSSKIHKGSVVNDGTNNLADVLADGGVKFIFTAHTHDHDIASYTTAKGNTIYDAVTTSINAYPCAYRVVSFGKDVKIETRKITAIDTSALPEGIHETALALAKSNFLEYAKNTTYLGLKVIISSYLNATALKKLLDTNNETVNAVIDKAGTKIEKIASMPMYTADETVKGESVETLAKELGTTLPATEYKTVLDLVVYIYQSHVEGDENHAAYTDEMILLTRALAVAINYALSDITTEDFTVILQFVAELLNANISDTILGILGGTLGRFHGSELFITTAVLPVLAEFGTDDPPKDNNVTLPGYNSTEKAESFLDKIISFFKKIFDFFRMLFAIGK
ncbi:MAG: metallophosphoesterase [Clostridia bacterium]|nr:metallophosphoesterase [Clostridia bacterium]